MNIEDQVLSVEQAKHLQELGLDMSDAALCWHNNLGYFEWHITFYNNAMRALKKKDTVPTYTLQEVLDKLPDDIIDECKNMNSLYIDKWEVSIYYAHILVDESIFKIVEFPIEESLLKAAYNMLCWVIENGYLEDKE